MSTATLRHKETQAEQILQHLVREGSITPLEALER